MQIELRDFRILRSGELPLTFTGRIVLRDDGGIEMPAGVPEEMSDTIVEAINDFAGQRARRDDAMIFEQEPFSLERAGERIVELREADIVEDPREIWLEYLESLSSGVRA